MMKPSCLGLLATTLTAGLAIGLSVAPSPAHALSCDSHHSEELDLVLVAVEVDGEALELDAVEDVMGTSFTRLSPNPDGPGSQGWINLNDAPAYDHWVSLEFESAIEPTAEVADYIANAETRSTGGGLCGGLPFVAAKPGVYQLETAWEDDDLPEGATVVLDAARESVVVEYERGSAKYMLEFEVVDFYFPEDRQTGCSVTGSDAPGPAGALWGLGLLALCAWRRPRSRSATN